MIFVKHLNDIFFTFLQPHCSIGKAKSLFLLAYYKIHQSSINSFLE